MHHGNGYISATARNMCGVDNDTPTHDLGSCVAWSRGDTTTTWSNVTWRSEGSHMLGPLQASLQKVCAAVGQEESRPKGMDWTSNTPTMLGVLARQESWRRRFRWRYFGREISGWVCGSTVITNMNGEIGKSRRSNQTPRNSNWNFRENSNEIRRNLSQDSSGTSF